MAMTTFPTLYSRTAKGAVNTWQVRTEGPEVICVWGQIGGKMQESRFTTEAKNTGKKNATTAEEQAVKEAEALVKKQLRKKYSETLEEASDSQEIRPMLAKSWEDQKHKLKWPAYCQPKLDGLRMMASLKDDKVMLQSRGNKFYNLPHIEQALAKVLKPEMVLDGELYCHGVSLQTINSLVRAPKEGSEQIQYWIYDMVTGGTFDARFKDLCQLASIIEDPLVSVPTGMAASEKEVIDFQKQCIQEGYEGCMVRSSSGKYRYGYRSPDLLKVKSWLDNEYKIVGYQVGKGKFQNVPIFKCATESGTTFDVTPKGTEEERYDMLQRADSLIGQWLTVKYFQLSPDEQVPLYPVGLSIRIAEDLP